MNIQDQAKIVKMFWNEPFPSKIGSNVIKKYCPEYEFHNTEYNGLTYVNDQDDEISFYNSGVIVFNNDTLYKINRATMSRKYIIGHKNGSEFLDKFIRNERLDMNPDLLQWKEEDFIYWRMTYG